MDQAPEQYRFDPDRGRRHRYSEDPTGQVPNVPVEIAETGPMVPATRRPAPGEQFEPIPPAPQHSQAPQNFTAEQQQQQSPFAPPNQDYSAPPNQQYSAPPAMNQEYAPPQQDFGVPQQHPGYSAPPMPGDYAAQQQPNQGPPQPNHEFGPPGANQEYSGPPSANGSAPSANQEYPAPAQDQSAPQQQFYSAPRQAMPSAPPANPQFAPPGVNQEYGAAPGVNQEYGAAPGVNQEYGAPPGANREYSAAPNQHYSAPPQQDFGAPQPNHEFAPPSSNGATPGVNQQYPAPAAPDHTVPPAPATPQEPPAPPAAPDAHQEQAAQAHAPQHTGPIAIPQPPATQTPSAPAQLPQSPVEQQTEQFPIVQPPPPVTEFSPTAVPSPPVTEQAPLRTPPANRSPIAEPTPPATVEKDVNDPESARLVDAVRQVPGVRDAFHVTAPDGASSLRLELEEGVDPDEVHAVVSAVVAEQRAVEPGPQSSDEPGDEIQGQVEPTSAEVQVAKVGAVELRRVEIESAGLEAEVSVTLALGDTESTGKVAVPPIDWHIQHAAAAATVEALRPRLGASDVRVEVEHASIVPTGPVKTAVVVILWLDGRSVRRLSGATVVTAERSRAVVSATLGALAAEVSH